ncbi:hypothetical protein C8A05DRAFT_43168 [Staphylotrichum tortipilum]|uniref:Uncharacterized protein n=1 Tax=Staphylotrichum tortipilum TaxID=2831512 RepID=A0AAN6MNR6_9PEZI|nr:hypothetical protein C8A05DRAFT_43168 [Staphylotrichum longicolle]
MKLFAALSLTLSLASAGAVLEPRHCAGNNCNRAVTGTRPGLLPLTVRSSHCASFLKTTVIPAASTKTITVDPEDLPHTTTLPLPATGAVTVTPTAIPDYAANCANAAEYVSACSCFGLTGTVTTAPRATVTVTVAVDYCEDI